MKLAIGHLLGITLSTLISVVSPAYAQSGVTERVSGNISGVQANNQSDIPAISADGRFVAFTSLASDLVAGDTNDASDVFVHDRRTGTTERVSVDSRGRQGDDHSGFIGAGRGNPAISADGRFVAFHSFATNLVPHDTNGSVIADVFVHDRLTGTTERVSVSSTGEESDGNSHDPAISADGRFVAFQSDAFNLVPKQNTEQFIDQIFVHDRLTGTTEIVSVNNAGQEGTSSSFVADISGDGRFVVFSSFADNLVAGTQFFVQVFLHDRATGTTERVSDAAPGIEGDGSSVLPVVSADGRFVAFESNTTNLVPDSTPRENHIYVRDRLTGTIERASVDSAGNAADLISGEPDLTPDGRFVTFYSLATNLVAGDTNNVRDIFVRDRQNGTTERVSVSTAGEQANSESMLPKISDDGLVIAFESTADNFVPDDTATGDIYVHDRRPAADLAVTQSDAPDPAARGGQLTYIVVVTNNGPAQATDVTLTDTLPVDVRFVSATPTAGSCVEADGTITCGLGTLNNGESATIAIVVRPRRAGVVTNTARVSGAQPDPNRADNTATEQTTVIAR